MAFKRFCQFRRSFKLSIMRYLSQQVVSEITETGVTNSDTVNQVWMYVATVEFFVIVAIVYFIIYKYKRGDLILAESETSKLKRELKKSDLNMHDVMNDINASRTLYKSLSRKCHPDRFVNTEKHAYAELLFQDISKNKRNYKALEGLRDEAEKVLEIKI